MDILKSVLHPQEFLALCFYRISTPLSHDQEEKSENLKTCYEFLKKTSRSFSMVIHQLDPEIRNAMCLFYLTLRALDTLEDDTTLDKDLKTPLILQFYKFLYQENWSFSKSSGDDRVVLERFPVISKEFRNLKKKYRDVISEICMKMGKGMIKFFDVSPESTDDWDEYCHYVAGLVGIGCTKLFINSGLENRNDILKPELSNSLGLFLQKTNIIRDYLEDVRQKRYFWPKQVWSKYVDNLNDFTKPEFSKQALRCLNELITNALAHAGDVIAYLSALSNGSIFKFTSIPQVMAIATLERCYNNSSVFHGVVKIRKGETIYLMQQASSVSNVKLIFLNYLHKIRNKIPAADPSAVETMQKVESAMQICYCQETNKIAQISSFHSIIMSIFFIVLPILFCYLWKTSSFDF